MDKVSPTERSRTMAQVKGKNTAPERLVRSMLHNMGFRFRLYRRDLPGAPDIVLPKWKTVVFMHGCFWHRHPGCKRASTPASNTEYWEAKFACNQMRDSENQKRLTSMGWKVIIVWECELRRPEEVKQRLLDELK